MITVFVKSIFALGAMVTSILTALVSIGLTSLLMTVSPELAPIVAKMIGGLFIIALSASGFVYIVYIVWVKVIKPAMIALFNLAVWVLTKAAMVAFFVGLFYVLGQFMGTL